ncbi:alpha/beta hydrolase [Camelliibacillus cellulosilyticus]|uniref:Alpha/beta hydrolase n=1 Tax=Camelliibacillus cellulosilyticus TaxID=2174486 RepID=A0ABV9GPH7_9BACL
MRKSKRQVEELVFQSQCLNEKITSVVHLPADYSPLFTYPILIVQDGQDYFNLGRLADLSEKLVATGQIHSIIIVAIPYSNVKDRWQCYHPNGKNHDGYLRFLVHELLPELSRRYAIDDIASERALLGDSLGATASLLAALRYPHTFGRVILQSPMVDEEVLNRLRAFNFAPQLSIYHSIGRYETAVRTTNGGIANFTEANQRLFHVLKDLPLAYYCFEEHEGDHTWTYWQDDLKEAMIRMFMRSETDRKPW